MQEHISEFWMYEPLESLTQEYRDEEKLLPNFTHITHEDKNHINKFRVNLSSMLIKFDRDRAKRDFHSYYSYLEPRQTEMQWRIKNIYPQELQPEICFSFYSYDAYVYKVLNSTLRASANPLKTVYVRLLFYDLFWSIKSRYDKNHRNQHQNLALYRGGIIKDEELQSLKSAKGGFIEMEGFLSTSLDRETAERFSSNVLFQIHVHDKDRDANSDFGFCSIQEDSQFSFERQYLFNVLNVFKVLNISGSEEMSVITLEYGSLAECVQKSKRKQNMSQEEKVLVFNYQYHLKQKERLTCQGDALFEMGEYGNALKYYESKIRLKQQGELSVSKDQENFMYLNLGKIHFSMREYQTARKHHQKLIRLNRESDWVNKAHSCIAECYRKSAQKQMAYHHHLESMLYHERTVPYTLAHIQIIFLCAKSYHAFKGTYDDFRYQLSTLCEIVENYHDKNSYEYAKTLIEMAYYYMTTSQFEKEFLMYQKAAKIIESIIGRENYEMIDIYRYMAGYVVRQDKDIPSALKYLEESKQVLEKLSKGKKQFHLNYIFLAYMYVHVQRIEEGLELCEWAESHGDNLEKVMAISLKSLVRYLNKQEQLSILLMKKALFYLPAQEAFPGDFIYKLMRDHAQRLNLI